MFKWTGSGGRRNSSGGGSRPGRVSAKRMGHAAPLETQVLRKPAFQPNYAQEHGFSPNTGRISRVGR